MEKTSFQIKQFILPMVFFFFTLFFGLPALRYYSAHSSFYDLGFYENKIWIISQNITSLKSVKLCLTSHFQPILLLYSIFYKFFPSAILLVLIQTITLCSASFPLYSIAKELFPNKLWQFFVIFLYFLYPAVQYNALFDFHPDHFYIPLALWAYYFAYKQKYLHSVVLIALSCLAKETFLLGGAFWGIYLIVKYKQYKLGGLSALSFFVLFCFIFFYIQPLKHLIGEEDSYRYLLSFFNHPSQFWNGILMNIPKKAIFLSFIFLPFLGIPLLCWKELIPALPLLTIQLLSTNPIRYQIASQYTAGIIPAVFMGYLVYLSSCVKNKGFYSVNKVIFLTLTTTIILNVILSPLPFSINFWTARISKSWNYSNYVTNKHTFSIQNAAAIIPLNKEIIITSQNNLNHPSFSKRYFYYPFPENANKSDYIVLDTSKPLFVRDLVNPSKYMDLLNTLYANPEYKLIFNEDSVLVFKRNIIVPISTL